ncbi:guanine deaminase [Mangrovimicrobium sediminis]|uniref:Guanine deaminase n=1 Tax=Mangrovimicrobium sediminis TaxID=2562682 RepID=A0A4Z0M4R7_9GAMM|nr:guanine deaminase [Haliea sp. SAOS-164]TGD74622.1 guanine deaminase [Haliea sp. SAOS-164]
MGSGILRGRILHCIDTPGADGAGVEYLEDGVLQFEDGVITLLADAREASAGGLQLGDVPHLGAGLIVPGFIDTHVHAPQLAILGSYGEQLMAWLERYTFPAEARFADPDYAAAAMDEFLGEMLRHGTTSALVFSTSHEDATEALFTAARARDLRLVAGKVLMDRNAPQGLLDTAASGEAASRRLIERWHGAGRLAYAVTPRFSITCSDEQLAAAGRLLRDYPGVYLQTHLAENPGEIAAVAELFPDAAHYLDTYDRHGLCGERSFFAHCVHLQPDELERLAATDSRVSLCPSSNMFLGSGLYDWAQLEREGVCISLGSDVGAGTSLSMLRTLGDAYRVCQLQEMSLPPMQGLYAVTLGNARALGVAERIGNLAVGSEADFLVLDPAGNPQVQRRLQDVSDIDEEWFVYMMLGDERLVASTWVAGREVVR